MSRSQICGTCEHFTLKDDSARAAQGIGHCLGYGEGSPHEKWVRWDRASTVLYGPAPDMTKRRQWIEIRKREEGGNAAADE